MKCVDKLATYWGCRYQHTASANYSLVTSKLHSQLSYITELRTCTCHSKLVCSHCCGWPPNSSQIASMWCRPRGSYYIDIYITIDLYWACMHPYPTRVRHFNHKGLHHLQFELAKTFVVKHLTLPTSQWCLKWHTGPSGVWSDILVPVVFEVTHWSQWCLKWHAAPSGVWSDTLVPVVFEVTHINRANKSQTTELQSFLLG